MSAPAPAHILVVRFSAMGDVAMSVRAVAALRKAWPDVRITVATKKKFARFFRYVEHVSVLCLPPDGSLRSLFSLIQDAEEEGVTHVADIHNTIRGKLIRTWFRLRGAKVAHLDKMRSDRRGVLKKKGEIKYMRHNVLRFCDVFADLGFPVPDPAPEELTPRPIPEAFGEKSGIWTGYAPFASKSMKIYPEDLSRELVGKMAAISDRLFIFSGPGKEKEFADEMASEYPNVTAVFGKTDIWGEIDLMSNLNALVTMDSSAMHMASMVGLPTVTVWGATHPAAGFAAYGADPDRSFVQLDLPCRPCSIYGEGKCRRGDFQCMRGIAPEMIISKVKDVLSENQPC